MSKGEKKLKNKTNKTDPVCRYETPCRELAFDDTKIKNIKRQNGSPDRTEINNNKGQIGLKEKFRKN